MFEHSMMNAPRRKPWMFSVSTMMQVGVVGGALVWPLLRIEALPAPKLQSCACMLPARTVTIVDTKAGRSSGRPRAGALTATARAAVRPFVAPTSVPQGVPVIFDDPGTIDLAASGGGPVGQAGIPGGWDAGPVGIGRIPAAAPPPRPVDRVAPAAAPPRVVQVGGQVRPPRLIHEVRPAYPVLARQARVAGVVKLAAVIAVDGSVQAVRVVAGHPLLVNAALEAVRQWRYEPTRLNNVPVEVSFTVDVNFNLR